jgi:glycosyltransferase involved in cell wall biosynthesis
MRQQIRLGVFASHPVQYHAPWFRKLAQDADLQVFFAHRPSPQEQATGFGGAFEWDVDLLSGYKHKFVPKRGIHSLLPNEQETLAQLIGGHRFDAFLVMGWNRRDYWQVIHRCRRAKVPVLVRCDSQLNETRFSAKRAAKQLTHRLALRQLDGFLSSGQRNHRYLRNYGVPPQKIFFVPPAVDNGWFEVKAKQHIANRRATRNRWDADDKTLVILYVGKFQQIKRPQDILHAIALLRSEQIPVVGIFVGAGEMDATLRSLAETLKVPTQFEGFKNQTELPYYYTASDVLVLPSEQESWGFVVNEAMVCGIPAVVSCAVGSAPDLIDEGETGFVFNVREPTHLARKLKKLHSLKLSGHSFANALLSKLSTFNIEQTAEQTLHAVRTVISYRATLSAD